MKNPVEEYLQEKRAFGPLKAVRPHASEVGRAVGYGAMLGAGGAAFAGLSQAASHMANAMTKSRDFKRMLDHNPDLQSYLEEDPKAFNQMYSSYRALTPEYTKEPMVAGALMRRAMESSADDRAMGVLDLHLRQRQTRSPALETAVSGFMQGTKMRQARPEPEAEPMGPSPVQGYGGLAGDG